MQGWTKELIYFSGDQYYAALTQAIRGARISVAIEVYIFRLDRVGLALLEELAAAAARGLRVRLLIDGFGSSDWSIFTLYQWRERGIEIAVYHPLPWQSGRISFRALGKLNRRNHRKVAILDGGRAFVGGMNICESHSEMYSGGKAWRDTMVELEGPAIQALEEAFFSAWAQPFRLGLPRRVQRDFWRQQYELRRRDLAWFSWVRRNHTRRLRVHGQRFLRRRFALAKRRIWITTPYFVPLPVMTRLLRRKAWQGVDVRLLLPRKNDVWFMTLVARAFYTKLIRSGVRVFEYEPRVLHAKSIVVDDWFLVGSANFNHRSFLHDLEVEVRVAEPSSRAKLIHQFEIDQALATEVLPAAWARRMLVPKILGWFFTRFRYWI